MSITLASPSDSDMCFSAEERICPICNKKFIPAPYHAWKIGRTVDDNDGSLNYTVKLVCSYTCMRKWEKEKESNKKKKKE